MPIVPSPLGFRQPETSSGNTFGPIALSITTAAVGAAISTAAVSVAVTPPSIIAAG